MAAHNLLKRERPAPLVAETLDSLGPAQISARRSAQPVALLQLEAVRGGDTLTARFDALSGWAERIVRRVGIDDFQNVDVFLVNGDTVMLNGVGFEFLTEVMREHYGSDFGSLFVSGSTDGSRTYVRCDHIVAWSFSQKRETSHLLGRHAISRIELSPESSFGETIVIYRKQPEDLDEVTTPSLPTRITPAYSDRDTYSTGALILFQGSLYRRAARHGNAGSPVERPEDWQYVRTEVGDVPAREAVQREQPKYNVLSYDADKLYGYGDLIRFGGRVYRKLTRNTRFGDPEVLPEDWDLVT